MDISPTTTLTGKAAVALATIAPLIGVVFATPGTMMIGEQYGTGALSFWLVGVSFYSGALSGSIMSDSMKQNHFFRSWLLSSLFSQSGFGRGRPLLFLFRTRALRTGISSSRKVRGLDSGFFRFHSGL